MKIKIYGGTKQDRHLCPTCNYSQIVEGQRDSETLTLCRYESEEGRTGPREVTFRVAECNKYREKSDDKLQSMYQNATYMYKLASGKWIGLHVGQFNDGMFMHELAKQDGLERDRKKEAEQVLKAAKASGK